MALLCGLVGCGSSEKAPPQDATAFVARLNQEMGALSDELNAASWTQATYITPDTQLLTAHANERFLAYFSKAVAEAHQYEKAPGDEATARALALLKEGVPAPAPDDAAKRAELAKLAAGLESAYGEGKYCVDKAGKPDCRNIDQLSDTLATSRDWDTLTEAWAGWHSVAKPMRQDYQRFVTLANEGARELGYADLGALWRSGYDMSPEDFEQEVERLWGQVRPLYEQMHSYCR